MSNYNDTSSASALLNSLLQQQHLQQQKQLLLSGGVGPAMVESPLLAAESAGRVEADEDCVRFIDRDPDPTNSPVVIAIFTVIYVNIFILGLVGNLSIVLLTLKHQPLRTVQVSGKREFLKFQFLKSTPTTLTTTQQYNILLPEHLHPQPGH